MRGKELFRVIFPLRPSSVSHGQPYRRGTEIFVPHPLPLHRNECGTSPYTGRLRKELSETCFEPACDKNTSTFRPKTTEKSFTLYTSKKHIPYRVFVLLRFQRRRVTQAGVTPHARESQTSQMFNRVTFPNIHEAERC